jgi:predicted Zn-dependent protease
MQSSCQGETRRQPPPFCQKPSVKLPGTIPAKCWRIGDAARALALADKLNQEFPVNTIQQSYWQPTIRAEIELSRNYSDKAIPLLQTAAPYELGGATPIGGLYPVFVRGQAFLRERQGARAAAEFQKLVDHRGIVQNLPLGALAHLYLGRAYVVGGDMARARSAYQDFLALWKDADIPILKEAKAEYAKLQELLELGPQKWDRAG